jgi:hypothetical protein
MPATREGGNVMISTTWAETMKVAALATTARKTATVVRGAVDVPWSWNPREVWLRRAKQPRDRVARSSQRGSMTPR